TAADEHERVLLQVVALTRDVCGDLGAVAQLHTGDLAHRRVRLLGRRGVHTSADTRLLRVRLQGRRVRSSLLRLATLANQLLNSWHVSPSIFCCTVTAMRDFSRRPTCTDERRTHCDEYAVGVDLFAG